MTFWSITLKVEEIKFYKMAGKYSSVGGHKFPEVSYTKNVSLTTFILGVGTLGFSSSLAIHAI